MDRPENHIESDDLGISRNLEEEHHRWRELGTSEKVACGEMRKEAEDLKSEASAVLRDLKRQERQLKEELAQLKAGSKAYPVFWSTPVPISREGPGGDGKGLWGFTSWPICWISAMRNGETQSRDI